MSNINNEIGRQGEIIAERFLIRQGYEILEKNFHSSQGEIDLIAKDGEFLVFVEVKNYSYRSYGSGLGAIRKSKRESIIHAAQTYLYKNGIKNINCRFDVVAIYRKWDGMVKIDLVKNAFQIR